MTKKCMNSGGPLQEGHTENSSFILSQRFISRLMVREGNLTSKYLMTTISLSMIVQMATYILQRLLNSFWILTTGLDI